jgi:PHD/YefM family antitoxin component YafN of YafNO toxin-antitoxin module
MTKIITASKARSDIYNLIDETANEHVPILITGKRHNAIMMSEEDYNAIQETLYLSAIPEMRESIVAGMSTSIDECSDTLDW